MAKVTNSDLLHCSLWRGPPVANMRDYIASGDEREGINNRPQRAWPWTRMPMRTGPRLCIDEMHIKLALTLEEKRYSRAKLELSCIFRVFWVSQAKRRP